MESYGSGDGMIGMYDRHMAPELQVLFAQNSFDLRLISIVGQGAFYLPSKRPIPFWLLGARAIGPATPL
jgi:hypothetical protein